MNFIELTTPKTLINLSQVNYGHVLRRIVTEYNLAQAIFEPSLFDVICNYSGLEFSPTI